MNVQAISLEEFRMEVKGEEIFLQTASVILSFLSTKENFRITLAAETMIAGLM